MHIEPWMILYAAVKLAAYTCWAYLGVRLFAANVKHKMIAACLYGVIRLVMGLLLGIGIFIYALKMNNAIDNVWLTYIAIYVPARILEWGVLFVILSRNYRNWRAMVWWILGGVVVSCLADIPLGFVTNWDIVPSGRPLC